MRNNTFRALTRRVEDEINRAIAAGVEPLALSIFLRNAAAQCDQIAAEFEKRELEEEEKAKAERPEEGRADEQEEEHE